MAGLSGFASHQCSPFATKISGEVANLQLVFTFTLLKQTSATFAKINKEMTKLCSPTINFLSI